MVMGLEDKMALRTMDKCAFKMNAGKTKYMVIVTKKQRNNIILRCFEFKLNETMKYLAIVIDDKRQYKDHCDYMLKKIGEKISFLNRIILYLRILHVSKSIITLHFEYCETLIINMEETRLNMLQKAQNGAMRIIL